VEIESGPTASDLIEKRILPISSIDTKEKENEDSIPSLICPQ